MKEQTRAEPRLSLCGLNCGLCPMYHISETEHCTGCGGAGRPSCAVQRCAREHGGVEYCFQCTEYPCARYTRAEPYDSFVPHRNVQRDFARAARDGLDAYRAMLEEKEARSNVLRRPWIRVVMKWFRQRPQMMLKKPIIICGDSGKNFQKQDIWRFLTVLGM